MAYFVDAIVMARGFFNPPPPVVPAKSAVGVLWEGAKLLAAETVGMGVNLMPTVIAERTSLEKKMIVAGIAYGAWAVYNTGLCEKVGDVGRCLLPGYRWVKSKLGRLDVVMGPEIRTRGTVLESRREGSDESEMTQIKSQARVGYIKDDKFVVIGCCVRFEGNYLVGPDHVLGGFTEKLVMGSQSRVSLRGKERIPLSTDLVAVHMTDQELSTIGIAVCKLGVVPDAGLYAGIVGPEGKGTTGRIINDPANFGRVIYYGTTIAGYSGAAYCVGTQVLGIHQMGGELNGGYSSTYAWMCLKIALKEKMESSDEWLLGQMQSGRKITWANVGDPEEVQVCVEGRYTVVNRDSMSKAFGRNWHLERELTRAGENRYDDSQLESADSGEAIVSKCPGASSAQGNTQVSSRAAHQNLIASFNQLSNKKAFKILKLLHSLGDQVQNMNGQVNEARPVS